MGTRDHYSDKPNKDLWKQAGFRSPNTFDKFRRDQANYGKGPIKVDVPTKRRRRK